MTDREFTFTRDIDDTQAIEVYLNPLPRSVIRRGLYQLLDGEWRFEIDTGHRGLHEHWYLGHVYPDTAMWPGSIEDQMNRQQDTPTRPRAWQDEIVAWYERDFTIPPDWCLDPECLVQVTFGACGHETRVWLNGHPLKTVEGDEAHLGEFTSFSYEFPEAYLQPVNRLTVRIADSFNPDIPRGKQESRVYRRGGIWYQTISGPVRSIWIEPIERNRLRSRLTVISNVHTEVMQFEVMTRIQTPGIYQLRVVVTPRGDTAPVATETFELALDAGNQQQWLAMAIPQTKAWSPDAPHLYHLVAQLSNATGALSQIETHMGVRCIEVRDHELYLNHQPVYLDGILYQPHTSTYEQIRRHLYAMKALGCNLVRIHIAGVDPRIYDLADEIGMLLWVEVPSPHRSSHASRANHWTELQRLLVIIGSHPSVIICSLYNEDWGAEDIATSAKTRDYITSTYEFMRLNYPHLLVVDNDGWHHVCERGRLKSDLLTAHLYTPQHAQWQTMLSQLETGQMQGVAARPLVVGDPFFYRGQLPLVISEWGGFGFTEYGGPEDPDSKTRRIQEYKHTLRQHRVAGDVYTQATSIEDENNGLIDPETGALLVPPGILKSIPTTNGK